jgi:hypothetical protein
LVSYLDKRNNFWTTFGQIILSVFFVGVIAILLLTKVITAAEGLPILSALATYGISKSGGNNKSNFNPPNPPDRDNK